MIDKKIEEAGFLLSGVVHDARGTYAYTADTMTDKGISWDVCERREIF
jgi:hypothetical protein